MSNPFEYVKQLKVFLLLKNSQFSNLLTILLLLLTTNLLLWVKQEGFFYYIFLNLIFIFHLKNKFYYRFYYIIISVSFLLIFISIKIHFFGSFRFNENVIHPNLFDNYNIIILFNKILMTAKYILISFFKYPLLIIIFSSIILFFKYNFFSKFYFLYTFAFLSFLLIFLIYIQTKEDISWLLPLTLNRLIFPISGFYAFLIVQLLNKFKH